MLRVEPDGSGVVSAAARASAAHSRSMARPRDKTPNHKQLSRYITYIYTNMKCTCVEMSSTYVGQICASLVHVFKTDGCRCRSALISLGLPRALRACDVGEGQQQGCHGRPRDHFLSTST